MASWKDRLALTAQRNRQDIVKAKLNRRDMLRMGLLTAGGSLVVKQGLSSRALADDGGNTPPSPPATPWLQAMPILPVKTSVSANQLTAGPTGKQVLLPPDGTSLINGATQRVPQQLFTVNEDGTFGGTFPPQKFYELDMQEAQVKLHPDYGLTTVWGFDGQVPGPLIQARYGEPVLVRYQNNLPSVKRGAGCSASPRSPPICTTPTRRPRATATRWTTSIRAPIRGQSIRRPASRSIHSASRISIIPMSMPAISADNAATTASPLRPAIRPRRWVRYGIMTTTSISPRRTSTRACSAPTSCSTASTPATKPPACTAERHLRHPDLLQRLPVRPGLPAGVRPVQPGWHSRRPVLRERRDPAIPERRQAALPLAAVQSRPVALVGVRAVRRHEVPAVLADLDRTATCCRRRCRSAACAWASRNGSTSSSTSPRSARSGCISSIGWSR